MAKEYKGINKETLKDEPTIALKNKVTADDLNYIKENAVEKVDNMLSMDENGGTHINAHGPIVSKYKGEFKNMDIMEYITIGTSSRGKGEIYYDKISLVGETAIKKDYKTGNQSCISINPPGLNGIYIGNSIIEAPIEKTDKIATLKDLNNRHGYKIIVTDGREELNSMAGELSISKPNNATLLGGGCYITFYVSSSTSVAITDTKNFLLPIKGGFKVDGGDIGYPVVLSVDSDNETIKYAGGISPNFEIQNRGTYYVLKSTSSMTQPERFNIKRLYMIYSAWGKYED